MYAGNGIFWRVNESKQIRICTIQEPTTFNTFPINKSKKKKKYLIIKYGWADSIILTLHSYLYFTKIAVQLFYTKQLRIRFKTNVEIIKQNQ